MQDAVNHAKQKTPLLLLLILPHIPHIHHMPNNTIRRNSKITRATQNRLRINILLILIQHKSMQHIRRRKNPFPTRFSSYNSESQFHRSPLHLKNAFSRCTGDADLSSLGSNSGSVLSGNQLRWRKCGTVEDQDFVGGWGRGTR